MWHEFVMFGGVLFWGIIGLVALVITAQIHKENIGWAFTTLLVLIGVLALFTNTPDVLAKLRPIDYLYIVLAYLGLAAVWAVIKWRGFYLPKLFRRYDDLRTKFLARKQLSEMPADPKVLQEFKDDHAVRNLGIDYNRMVSHNKARITTWMIFWPFSLFETFIGDFLTDIFDRIYRNISGLLQRMSDSMASKYSELN